MNATTFNKPAFRKTARNATKQLIVYSSLFVGAVLVALPFYWLVRSSLMVEGDHFVWPPIIWPKDPVWHNYVDIFQISYIPMPTFFKNSVILVTAATIGEVISTSLVGFGFSRLQVVGTQHALRRTRRHALPAVAGHHHPAVLAVSQPRLD